MSEREKTIEKKEDTLDEQQEVFAKKITDDHHKRQESRMMNFFNQEFLDRKIDFKPK
jgi:hypothetical protein